MSQQPIDKNYVSGMDKFLKKFDKDHPQLSPSQQKEQDKYKRIYKLRDTDEKPAADEKKLWEGF
jgi:hypothetical protein